MLLCGAFSKPAGSLVSPKIPGLILVIRAPRRDDKFLVTASWAVDQCPKVRVLAALKMWAVGM